MLAVVLIVAASDAVWAAKLPEWARAIADTAPPVPEGMADTTARVLFRQRSVAVESDGTVRTRLRVARQILTSRQEVGLEYFPFGPDTKIEFSRAWHLSTKGKATRTIKADFVDLSLSDAFLSDAKSRIVAVDGLERGSLVFFEFRSREVPISLEFSEVFWEPYPIDHAELEVTLPPTWRARYEWLRGPGPEPRIGDGTHTWTLKDLPVVKPEAIGPSGFEQAPLLVVGPQPPAGVSIEPEVFSNWSAMSAWYEDLSRGRNSSTPEIETVAAGLNEGSSGEERVAAVARFVRDKIRYLANAIGEGGYRPREASDTLANRYGDCKDKATLMGSMLSTMGRASYPVLVSSEHADTVADSVPSLDSFDHLILAVALPEERVAEFPRAVVRAEDLGPLLLVDTTDEFTSFGWIPAHLENRKGLLVAGERSRLIDLPDEGPEAHRIIADVEVTVTSGQSVTVISRAAYYGQPAADRRRWYRESSAEYRQAWERRLRDEWIKAEVESFEVELESADGALVETAKWSSPRLIGERPSRRLRVFPGLGAFIPEPTLRRREVPVRYEHRCRIDLTATVSGIPAGAGLPEPVSTDGDGWAVASDFERDGTQLRGTATIVLDRKQFQASDFRGLRRFFSAKGRALSASVWVDR